MIFEENAADRYCENCEMQGLRLIVRWFFSAILQGGHYLPEEAIREKLAREKTILKLGPMDNILNNLRYLTGKKRF